MTPEAAEQTLDPAAIRNVQAESDDAAALLESIFGNNDDDTNGRPDEPDPAGSTPR